MSRPKCPNHTVEMDKTDNPRIWICPISNARFECDVATTDTTMKRDKFGNITQQYVVHQADGGVGG